LLGLSSGYVARAADELPKQGSKAPWFLPQNYVLDLLAMQFARIDNPSLAFSCKRDLRARPEPTAVRLPRGVAR
jgi:hypothetical protein